MLTTALEPAVAEVRAYNRFYTALLGVLSEGLLQTDFSLTECRVLYELATREGPSATELGRDLRLDPAYLSRILRKFRASGLVSANRSTKDGRERILSLSESGWDAFAKLDEEQDKQVSRQIEPLMASERADLLKAMHTIRTLLGDSSNTTGEPYLIRPHRPGDMGWVVHRHGALYAQEYGFDETFEALVAEIAADFLKTQNPKREQCWMAERHGEIVGSVTCVDHGNDVAKLRLLYVEPQTRGLGIGARLVDECLHFARNTGYRRMTLWTNAALTAAINIYKSRGFKLTAEESGHEFSVDVVNQTWELEL